jgi:hypothetical protein
MMSTVAVAIPANHQRRRRVRASASLHNATIAAICKEARPTPPTIHQNARVGWEG